MSDQFNSFQSPIKNEVVEQIEQLDLSTLQKLHLKLLTHCLEIFKNIANDQKTNFPTSDSLSNWCESESQKLRDAKFGVLLFEQMHSASRKLKKHAEKINKNPLDLTLDDLITLVSSSD